MHILIINNDARMSGFIKKGLSVEGYHTSIAQDGPLGLTMSLSDHYDVVLLNVTLPTMSGLEVCQQLRRTGLYTPILIFSTLNTVEVRVKSFDSGADDFLIQPFAFEELLARINALLRRELFIEQGINQRQYTQPTLQAADLLLDHQAHIVRKAGNIIELTPTEFILLEYLMQHSNCVVSRTMIENQVWGYDKDPLTNIVDVYIRRLRKKLDAQQIIKTVRGVGYQLLDVTPLATTEETQ